MELKKSVVRLQNVTNEDEQMGQRVRAMAKKIGEAFDRELLGTYTNPPLSTLEPDIVADLDRVKELFSRPVPVAIWFIDRPDVFRQVMKQMVEVDRAVPARAGFVASMGLPLYQWTLAEIEAEVSEMVAEGCSDVMIAERFPFQLPGVWVQMRNAPHMWLISEAELDQAKDRIKRLIATLSRSE